jgi:8-oxo-dGTP diphosphatase
MPLLVVRHARAGRRSHWNGPDVERPLSGRGRKQAEALARQLSPYGPKRILTSPYVRCVQTVEPLARDAGLGVEMSDALAEGAPAQAVTDLASELTGTTAVLCTHGDVVATLLDLLVGTFGLTLPDELPCAKGSTWLVGERDGRLATAQYLPPSP